jgi:hypothetical protein
VIEKASEKLADKAASEQDKRDTLGTEEALPREEKRRWRLRMERQNEDGSYPSDCKVPIFVILV